MKRLAYVMGMALVLLALMAAAGQQLLAYPLLGGSRLEFLGEGGTYSVGPGEHFIVKHKGPFVFVNEPGPTYAASGDERVWAATMNAPAAVQPGQWIDYGQVPSNCEVSYTAIDDDEDERINIFYLDEAAVHEMSQGMVTGGKFTTSKAGNLRLYAADSIGIWLNKCPAEEPSPTAETPATITPSPTPKTEDEPTPESSGTPFPPEPTAKPTQAPTATATKKPRLPACLRINFETSGGEALEGVYEVREVGGRLLYSWYAQAGWRDSGWIYGIDISFEDVYIEVFYLQQDGPPIKLDIMNPAAGTSYGWLSRGMCHSLEVGWPDPTITPTPTPDAYDGYNDSFDLELLDLLRYIWPGIEPTPTPTPASSLRG